MLFTLRKLMISPAKTRLSNMELLRVISMMLIMCIHGGFWNLSNPLFKWSAILGSDVGVNCFVLISGYFGIRPKISSLASFIFQIYFFVILSDILVSLSSGNLAIPEILRSLNLFNISWFINAYLVLYFFAQVLNCYAENATRKQFQYFLAGWAIIEFFLGYVTDYMKFERGYTFLSFILLYMIARYIRIHGGKIFSFNKHIDLFLYVIFTLLGAVFLSFLESIGKVQGGLYYLHAYNSPLMIIASIYLMLFFSKLSFKSVAVNWLGRSAYAAFLLHSSTFLYDKYRSFCLSLFTSQTALIATAIQLFVIVLLFIIAVLIDQFRLFIWRYFKAFLHIV